MKFTNYELSILKDLLIVELSYQEDVSMYDIDYNASEHNSVYNLFSKIEKEIEKRGEHE